MSTGHTDQTSRDRHALPKSILFGLCLAIAEWQITKSQEPTTWSFLVGILSFGLTSSCITVFFPASDIQDSGNWPVITVPALVFVIFGLTPTMMLGARGFLSYSLTYFGMLGILEWMLAKAKMFVADNQPKKMYSDERTTDN